MRILYATDGSSHARAAGNLLAGLKLTPKDHITIFTVDDRSGDIDFEDIYKGALAALSGTAAATDLRTGKRFADEAIIKEGRESKADLLVLGAKGTSSRSRSPMGRDARRVLRYAPCSVLVARPNKNPMQNVLLAFDGTGPSLAAAAMLLNFPLAPETRIHLVTVLAPLNPRHPQRTPTHLYNGLDEGKVLDDLSRINDDLRAAGRLVKMHTVRGKPAACLLDYAQSEEINLMVLGFYSTSLTERILRFLLRSVSERVARHAPCSILLAKQSGE